jgi:hypothetical protein
VCYSNVGTSFFALRKLFAAAEDTAVAVGLRPVMLMLGEYN